MSDKNGGIGWRHEKTGRDVGEGRFDMKGGEL